VEQSAEKVAPAELQRMKRLCGHGIGSAAAIRRSKVECSVWTLLVEVADVDAEDVFELAATEDQESIEHSLRTLPTQRSAWAFGAWIGVRTISMPSLRKMLSKAGLNFMSRFVDQEARRLACVAQDKRAWPLDVSEEADDANAVRPVDRLPGVSLAKRLAVRCEPDILFLVDDRLREAAVLIEEDVVEAVVVLHDVDVEAPGSSRANIRVNKRFEAGIEGAADRHGRRRGSCEYERRQYRCTEQ
jgi:hypothetical protein